MRVCPCPYPWSGPWRRRCTRAASCRGRLLLQSRSSNGPRPSRSRARRQSASVPNAHCPCCAVAPVHVSPAVAVGIVLVKHMVPAILVETAVGIVDPASRRSQVIDGALGIPLCRRDGFFDTRRGPENRVCIVVKRLLRHGHVTCGCRNRQNQAIPRQGWGMCIHGVPFLCCFFVGPFQIDFSSCARSVVKETGPPKASMPTCFGPGRVIFGE